jgi:hypothetical protein
VDIFIARDKIAWIWFGLFILAILGFAVDRQMMLSKIKDKPLIIAMDANDTYYLPASMDFENAAVLHAQQTRLAMEAFFNRNPGGVDNSDLLKYLYSKAAFTDATQKLNQEKKMYQDQQIHSKIELGDVKVLSSNSKAVLTSVEGQLIRTGLFDGKLFSNVYDVKAQFTFVLNKDMKHNGRFPTVVTKFDFQYFKKGEK